MAFSLPGFGAGLSSTLNEILTTRNTRIAAREDEEASIATKLRLSKQADRDSKNEISKKLAEKLSAMYTPEVAERFMAQGVGYAEHYLDIGAQANADNVDPMSFINADALAVPMLLPDGSNRAAVEKAALRFGSAAEGGYVSLINREALFSRAGKAEDLKVYTTFEQQVAGYSSQYTDLMNPKSPRYNPKKAEPYIDLIADAKAAIIAEAEADPDKKPNIFSDVSRTVILKDFRRDQLQKQQFSMGIEDQIEKRIYGDNSRQHVAEIAAMNTVDVFNKMEDGSIADLNLSNVAAYNRENAEKELRKIASLTYAAGKVGTDSAAGEEQTLGLQNKFKAVKGSDGLYVSLSEKQLQTKVASGELGVGDVVIYFNPITKTNQLIIYTGAGELGFIGAAALTAAQMRYE